MKKIHKSKDSIGLNVIYVEECEKYLEEQQEVNITQEERRIYDIISSVENYYNS